MLQISKLNFHIFNLLNILQIGQVRGGDLFCLFSGRIVTRSDHQRYTSGVFPTKQEQASSSDTVVTK